jgi:anti-sigma-K factor RskA
MNRREEHAIHEELRGLCAAHALGILDENESSRLEAHLRTECGTCRGEIESYRRTVADMGVLLDEEAPPAGAAQRFRERLVPAAAAPPVTQRSQPARRWLLPAAAMLAVASSLWVALDSRREVSRLQEELEAFETITDPVVPIFDLKPTAAAGGGRARATFDPRSDMWRLFAHDVAPPPPGSAYQGWLVTAEGPLDLGVFVPDDGGHGFLALQAAHPDAQVRVTLEPADGSEAPTGPAVFEPVVTPGR